jgi:hypothetical protein
MSGIDRSKFRSTSVAVAKQADQETEAKVSKGDKGPNADYHKIVDGMQYHRIYPPHPSDGGVLYAVPKGIHWIPQEVPKKDKQGNFVKDDKGKFELTVANRPIFNARIHSSKKKDIVEEYIAFCEKVAKELHPTSEEERKKFLDPVHGGFESKFDGIMLRQTWVSYTDQLIIDAAGNVTKSLGRLEMGKAIKNRLNAIAATESASDPLGTDPFTDPDEGRAISIKYDKNAKKAQDYYNTELYAPIIPGGKGQIRLFPLSDDDLTKFEAYPSLKKMFIESYDRKMFDTALKGLKLFDDEHELGIFAYEEFLDICDELAKEWPEVEGEKTGEVAEEKTGDQFDDMDRDELKAFIRENKLGIIVNKQLDDDAVRAAIRAAFKPVEEEEEEEEHEEEEEESDANTAATGTGKEGKNDLPWEESEEGKEAAAKKVAGKTTVSISQKLKDAAAKRDADKAKKK